MRIAKMIVQGVYCLDIVNTKFSELIGKCNQKGNQQLDLRREMVQLCVSIVSRKFDLLYPNIFAIIPYVFLFSSVFHIALNMFFSNTPYLHTPNAPFFSLSYVIVNKRTCWLLLAFVTTSFQECLFSPFRLCSQQIERSRCHPSQPNKYEYGLFFTSFILVLTN